MTVETRRCPQCWKVLPFPACFIGARGAPIRRCQACQEKYANWQSKTDDERIASIRNTIDRSGAYRVLFTKKSGNAKTGPIPVSITSRGSCPDACAFTDVGCYALYGRLGMWWRRAGDEGMPWDEFVALVRALPFNTLWRHNEAGDLPGFRDKIDVWALKALVRANRGKRGFTFTHKPVLGEGDVARVNRDAIRRANADGFTINLSADSVADADRLADLGIAPVAVALAHDHPDRGGKTPAGRRLVVCPAQTNGLTCEECRLCAHPTRASIIGFRAHGQSARLVTTIVRRRSAAALEATP